LTALSNVRSNILVRTRPTGRRAHEIAEIPPERCSNGHPIVDARTALIGFVPCACAGIGGHRSYRCTVCGVTDLYPPHHDADSPAG
jgi:hypothetical protein